MQALAPLQKLVHAVILAKLQQDVNILAVFEKVLEVAHMVVLDAAMDFDLTH